MRRTLGEVETTMWRRWVDALVERWWIDLPIVLAVVLVLALLLPAGSAFDLLGTLDLQERRASYDSLNGIVTFLAGFSSVSLALYLGWSSRELAGIKRVVGKQLLSMWLSAVATPWLCALAIWVAGLADRGAAGMANQARWVVTAAFLLVITSLARNVYVFAQLAQLEQRPAAGPTRPVAAQGIGVRRR